jgi:hypothetical protein
MRRLVVTLVTVVSLATFGEAVGSSNVSGLRGLVTLSPTRPVCPEEQPCSKPAARVVLLFRRNGHVAARVTTRANGAYRVLLRPRTYTVVAPAYRVGTGVSPRVVRVPDGRVARIDLEIDTGIQ